MNDEPDDPILEAQIEAEVARALGPGVGVLPKEVLDEARLMLRIGLKYHPDARRLLKELRPEPSVDRSDERATAALKNEARAKKNGGAR
jgi:hypothetical protein